MSHFDESHPIDRSDAVLKDVSALARRIVKILEQAGDTIDSDLQEWLDDLLGAIYAMVFSKERNYDPKSGPDGQDRRKEKLRVLKQRAKDLADGTCSAVGM